MLSSPNVIWQPQPGPQALLLTCPVPDVMFGGARGGGKSDALLGDWTGHASRYGKHARGLLVRRTLTELDEIIARSQVLFTPLGASYSVGKSTWTFPNGAVLKFRYLESDDDATRYQGHQYTWVAIDEAGNFKSAVPIDMLRGTLRSAAGVPCVMRLTANPGGKGHQWLMDRYVKNKKPLTPFYDREKDTWRVFIPSKLADNKILVANDPTYVSRLRGAGPSWLVKAWLDGDWNISMDGEIFKREWWKTYVPGTAPETLQIVQFWDTGYKTGLQNSRSACVTAAITRRGVYVLDLFAKHLEYPDLKREVVDRARRFNCYTVGIEDKASGQSLLQELKRETGLALIPAKASASRLDRWLPVTPLIESGRMLLPTGHQNLSEFIEEMSNAREDAGRDDYANATAHLLKYVGEIYAFSDHDPGYSLLDIYS